MKIKALGIFFMAPGKMTKVHKSTRQRTVIYLPVTIQLSELLVAYIKINELWFKRHQQNLSN